MSKKPTAFPDLDKKTLSDILATYCRNGSLESVKEYIKEGADVNQKDFLGRNSLFCAAEGLVAAQATVEKYAAAPQMFNALMNMRSDADQSDADEQDADQSVALDTLDYEPHFLHSMVKLPTTETSNYKLPFSFPSHDNDRGMWELSNAKSVIEPLKEVLQTLLENGADVEHAKNLAKAYRSEKLLHCLEKAKNDFDMANIVLPQQAPPGENNDVNLFVESNNIPSDLDKEDPIIQNEENRNDTCDQQVNGDAGEAGCIGMVTYPQHSDAQ